MIYGVMARSGIRYSRIIRMIRVTLNSMAIGTVLLMAIDIPWLYINQSWASKMIRGIQYAPMKIRLLPAALVYVFMAYLLLIPKSYGEAFLMGVAVYGVYDATNYATLDRYCPVFAVADTLWGGVLLSTAWWIRGLV